MGVSPYKKKGHQFKVEREGPVFYKVPMQYVMYTVSNNKLYSHIIVIVQLLPIGQLT